MYTKRCTQAGTLVGHFSWLHFTPTPQPVWHALLPLLLQNKGYKDLRGPEMQDQLQVELGILLKRHKSLLHKSLESSNQYFA
eukprot:1160250-Pelagomonas_calceolata.AAC.1